MEGLTNLDELLLRIVWAFPKASRMGLASRICLSSMPRPEGPPSTRFRLDPERMTERVDVERWRKGGAVAASEEEEAGAGTRDSVAMAARYWITFLVFSVFPAPDSPLQTRRRGFSEN